MKKIILFSGKLGSGKDPCADFLIQLAKNKNILAKKMSFAEPLKALCAEFFEFPLEWAYSRQGKENIPSLGGGKTVGEILQLVGTEVTRSINANFWVEKMKRQINADSECDLFIIPDCRFLNEAASFQEENLLIDTALIHLSRVHENPGSRNAEHPSEKESDLIYSKFSQNEFERYFISIDNRDSSVEETLQELVEKLHQKFEWSKYVF